MNRQFYVLAYKSDAGTYYGAAGKRIAVNCNHTIVGDYGMNTGGEIVNLPPGNIVTAGAQSVLIPHVTQFPDTTQPGLTLTKVKLIKDNDLQTSYYVDTTDYLAKVVGCNPIPYATACPVVTRLDAGTPGPTDATITWNENPAITGIEFVNDTSAVEPVVPGTFLPVGTGTVYLATLISGTDYYFWIRTICTGGVASTWELLQYTTP